MLSDTTTHSIEALYTSKRSWSKVLIANPPVRERERERVRVNRSGDRGGGGAHGYHMACHILPVKANPDTYMGTLQRYQLMQ